MIKGSGVSIVGAGLAGSLMSIFLAQRGYDVTVFEGRPDMRVVSLDAGRSINLALANRGLRALEQAGLREAVEQLLTPMTGRMIHDQSGELQFQPYGQRESEVVYSISRPGLNELLMNRAEHSGVEIRFNQRCIDVDVASPTLHFEDANEDIHTISGAPIIAADGSGSIIRRRLVEQALTQATEDYLAHGYKELTIPATPDGDYQMAPNALHIWPRGGYMLIALPNLGGSFTVTLFMPSQGAVSFAALDTEASAMQFFDQVFPDVVEMIPELAQDFFANPTGSMVTVMCSPWRSGSGILLLGDAAHAIVPFHGQGMNCAFEDCHELDACIEDKPERWSEVFAEFEDRRKPNTDAIADLALENYVEMRDTIRDPGFHLKKELAWELEKLYPDVFIPRYSMVMFRHIPYAQAQRRGEIQKQILDTLVAGISNIDEVDYLRAAELIEAELLPLVG